MKGIWGDLKGSFLLRDSLSWLTSPDCAAPLADRSSGAEFWVVYLLLGPCSQHLLVIGVHVVFLVLFALRNVSCRIIFKQAEPGFAISRQRISSNYYFTATAALTVLASLAYSIAAVWGLVQWIFNRERPLFEALYPAYLWINALAWVSFVGTVAYEKRLGALGHPLALRVWWAITFILSALQGAAVILRLVLGVEGNAPASLKVDGWLVVLTLPATAFLFIVSLRGSTGIFVVGSVGDGLSEPLLYGNLGNGKNALPKDSSGGVPESAYAQAGFFSRVLWLWMNTVLQRGSKRTLQLDDVPLLAPEDRAGKLFSLLESCFPKELGRNAVGLALLTCFRKSLLLNGLLTLTRVCVMYVGPILITQFVDFSSGSRQPVYKGYMLVLILLAAKCTEVLASHHYNFNSQRLGMLVRSSMITTVYRKGLRLSNAGRQAHGLGQIVNYMTVDVQQLSDSVLQLHNLWAVPLQVVVAVIILFQAVGLAMFAGLATMIGVVALSVAGTRMQKFCQTHIMKHRDLRMKATAEALNSMKIIKLQAWEEHFRKRVEDCRSSEYQWLIRFIYYLGRNTYLVWNTATLVSVVTFTCAALIGFELTPASVFTAGATFRILQEPVRAFPQALIAISQALVSLDRLDKFMQSDELDAAAVARVPKGSEFAISVEGGSFTWDVQVERPTLTDINIRIQTGSLVTVVGMVGSGKSSLLSSFLGEMPKLAGQVTISGTTAYVPQTAWIQNGTIEENILFGKAMDQVKYQETLRVCSLETDLELLEFGDQTEIGERGINLSGGQKQRIQLARAVYQDCDVYLLDDVFSAVDAHTGSDLFKNCILGTLAGKTRVLVTHQVEFLHGADQILVMRDGYIAQCGKYNDLLQAGTEFDVLVQAHNDAMDSVDTERGSNINRDENLTSGDGGSFDKVDGSLSPPRGSPRAAGSEIISSFRHPPGRKKIEEAVVNGLQDTRDVKKGTAKLIDEERRATGRVGWSVYWLYLTKAYGWPAVVALLLLQLIWQSLLVASDYWLAYETSPEEAHFKPSKFILGYLYLAIGIWTCVLIRTILVLAMGVKSAQSFFYAMLRCVFRAPMSFFDTTPSGRILSRSSSDQATVDIMLHVYCGGSLGVYSAALATLVVICQVTWQVVFVIVPLGYIYISYQSYYIRTSRELTRIDSITKAPVIHHFSESVAGFAVIRSFQKQEKFAQVNVERVDSNLRLDFHNNAANEWLGYRLEMIGTIVLCSSALLLVALPQAYIKSDLVGLSLSYGLALNTVLYWSVLLGCTVENKMVSVERLRQFSVIPSEAPLVVEGAQPSADWPHKGEICIRDLQMRYRPNTPLVLKGISVTIQGGQKVGVVGRTGSGKSTLLQALFRLVEPAGGSIIIDGVDICGLGLTDLRSRLSIIPQEPTLFEGSIRMNIDPLGHYKDEEIWEVLHKCQLERTVRDLPQKLDSQVVGNGENWSVGQRQLFCLGRVLLRRSRILFLDEATASVDSHTDGVIQKTVREEFFDCTLVSIAHRIPTVMDSDSVLVLDAGKVKEHDNPATLLQQPTSLFAALVREYSTRSGSIS